MLHLGTIAIAVLVVWRVAFWYLQAHRRKRRR